MDKAKQILGCGDARCALGLQHRLKFLNPREVTMIDDFLASVAPFGEVRLEVQKGRLRFVSSVKSHDALQLTGGPAPDLGDDGRG